MFYLIESNYKEVHRKKQMYNKNMKIYLYIDLIYLGFFQRD